MRYLIVCLTLLQQRIHKVAAQEPAAARDEDRARQLQARTQDVGVESQ